MYALQLSEEDTAGAHTRQRVAAAMAVPYVLGFKHCNQCTQTQLALYFSAQPSSGLSLCRLAPTFSSASQQSWRP
jgi:hypothetical protein